MSTPDVPMPSGLGVGRQRITCEQRSGSARWFPTAGVPRGSTTLLASVLLDEESLSVSAPSAT